MGVEESYNVRVGGAVSPGFLCVLGDEGEFVNRISGVSERGCLGLWWLGYYLFYVVCDVDRGGDVVVLVLRVAECGGGYCRGNSRSRSGDLTCGARRSFPPHCMEIVGGALFCRCGSV